MRGAGFCFAFAAPCGPAEQIICPPRYIFMKTHRRSPAQINVTRTDRGLKNALPIRVFGALLSLGKRRFEALGEKLNSFEKILVFLFV